MAQPSIRQRNSTSWVLDKLLGERWEDSHKVVENDRLVWYSGSKSGGSWNDHWQARDAKGMLEAARRGHYPHREVYHKYLDKSKPVLEGGCGVGHIVLGLQTDGYDAMGVEQTTELIDFIRKLAPDCNVKVGDILNLSEIPDEYLGGYISLGVVEHFPEGPQNALKEANRVLCMGGRLIITVPYFNSWRRVKARRNLYPAPNSDSDLKHFYQYAFTKQGFITHLEQAGFSVEETDHVAAAVGVGREFWSLGRSLRKTYPTRKILAATDRVGILRHLFGHSALYVARKVKDQIA